MELLYMALAAALLLWAVRTVVRGVRRQLKHGCGGDCAGCSARCPGRGGRTCKGQF